MFVLKKGRSAFLEHLRNLNGQVFLIGIALFITLKIREPIWQPANLFRMMIVPVLFLVCALAWWANAVVFLERYLDSDPVLARASARLVARTQGRLSTFTAARLLTRKRHRRFRVEFALMLIAHLACLMAVWLVATLSAVSYFARLGIAR